ncbi:MAG: hypothetical protein R3A46_13265 [Thermomicrobiales bacterium]
MRILTALLIFGTLVAACSGPGGDNGDPTAPQVGGGEQQAATTPIIGADGGDQSTSTDSGVPTQPPTGEPLPSGDQQGQTQPPVDPQPTTPVPNAPTQPQTSPHENLLPTYRIISYYGHPSTPTMGILGSGTKDELLVRLQNQAAEYSAIDPATPNKLAFEIIATVAQPYPGPEGTYLLYTGDEWIGEYVDFATANDMIVILDLQIGHNTIENEINRVRHWLALPNVHVALDPEFATAANDIPRPDRVPGSLIGEISGYQVQTAIDMLDAIVAENNIPNKVLIVHQFEEEMIYEKQVIVPKPGVDIVVDVDGFGPPANKIGGYEHFVRDELIEYGGIKLFFTQDDPMLDPATVIGLDPSPAVVIYQ